MTLIFTEGFFYYYSYDTAGEFWRHLMTKKRDLTQIRNGFREFMVSMYQFC